MMAFYVKLHKTGEDADSARYTFFESEADTGEVEIDKRSGEVALMRPLLDLRGDAIAIRAAARLRSAWRGGVMPETAEWAS